MIDFRLYCPDENLITKTQDKSLAKKKCHRKFQNKYVKNIVKKLTKKKTKLLSRRHLFYNYDTTYAFTKSPTRYITAKPLLSKINPT